MRKEHVLGILSIYLLLWPGNLFAAQCPQTLRALSNWYETAPSFSGIVQIHLVATFRNNFGGDIEFDSLGSDTFQLWSQPSVSGMPVIINTAPSGIVSPGGNFTYDLTIDVSSLPSSENILGFRPVSITLGTMAPGVIPIENVSFSCTNAPSTLQSVPTLNEWGMLFMSLTLFGAAFWMVRRRRML